MGRFLLFKIAFITALGLGMNCVKAQDVTLTQSVSQSIISLNSVACNAGTYTVPNSYWRVFDLPSYNVGGECLNVTNVEFGIELASAIAGNQKVLVRLHTLTGATLIPANLTFVSVDTFTVTNQNLTIYNATMSRIVPSNSKLVVEIHSLDGSAGQGLFFIGSNSLGQTGTGYLSASSCGINDPTDIGVIGFPGMHIVMNVKGDTISAPTAPVFSTFVNTVCAGAVGVNYSVVPVTGSVAYYWSYSGAGATINSSGPNASINFSSSATGGMLSVYYTNGCGNSSIVSQAITIDTSVVFPITPTNPEICIGDTITLTVSGGVSYRWEPPTGLDTLYGPVVNASPGLSHSYTVIGDDGNGCTGTGTVFVTVHPLPTVVFEPENTTVCAGIVDTIVLRGAATYAWLPTTGLTLSATGDTAIVNLNSTSTYTIEAVSHYGCENTATKTINVNPNPSPVITFNGERLLTAPTGYVQYMWYVDGLPIIPVAWQHLYNIKKPGTYHVVVTDSNGCEGVSNSIDTKTTGIGEFNLHQVRIFPNPATNSINIESPLAVNVNILTIEGRKVLGVENAKAIDISKLSNGIYFLEIIEPKSNAIRKEKIIKSE